MTCFVPGPTRSLRRPKLRIEIVFMRVNRQWLGGDEAEDFGVVDANFAVALGVHVVKERLVFKDDALDIALDFKLVSGFGPLEPFGDGHGARGQPCSFDDWGL